MPLMKGVKLRPRVVLVLLLPLLAAGFCAHYSIRKWNEYKFLAATKRYDCQDYDLKLLYRIRPHCEGKHSHLGGGQVPFRTNSYGLFEREVGPKRKGVPRILLLGDSQLISYDPGFSLAADLDRRLKGSRVELVNGATPGYSLVQLRLRARELIQAYQPDILLFYYHYGSMGLNTTYLHLAAEQVNAEGLVESIGAMSFFWPLPDFLAERMARSAELRFLATWLRAWQERALLLFGTARAPWFSAAKRGGPGISNLQEQYLTAMARESEASGARFYLLRATDCEAPLIRPGMKYFKAETAAVRTPFLMPRYLAACEETRGRLAAAARVIDDPLRAPDESYFLPGDVHFSENGMREVSAQLERAVRHALGQGGKR